MTPERKTAYLGYANTISSVVIALLAPVLGSIADQGNSKRRFLAAFTLLGAAATAALPLAAKGEYLLAAALYAVAALGFSGNNLFTDALLTDVAEPRHYDRVSARGYALGYLGSGGLFVVCTLAVKDPAKFGLAGPGQAVNAAFLVTAVWWLVFTVPALLWVRETAATPPAGSGSALARGLRQLAGTFRELRRDRRLLYFLGGYILYIDGVNTVIKMAVVFGRAIGLDSAGMLLALIVTQFVAFPAAIVFGAHRRTLRGAARHFARHRSLCGRVPVCDADGLAAGVFRDGGGDRPGAGGVQSLSRSFFARIIPPEKGGEYFGFYNLLGKFAAVLGPTLMGVTAMLTDARTSILALLVLFAGGGWLLSRVRE
jgi:UMF1 family MFS transporter